MFASLRFPVLLWLFFVLSLLRVAGTAPLVDSDLESFGASSSNTYNASLVRRDQPKPIILGTDGFDGNIVTLLPTRIGDLTGGRVLDPKGVTKVRVHIGWTHDDGTSGGRWPTFQFFRADGSEHTVEGNPSVGWETNPNINPDGLEANARSGQFLDYEIPSILPYDPHSLEYMSLRYYHKDAICISAVGIVGPDGKEYAILGDVMHKTCNWQGFPSKLYFPMEGEPHTPHCFWMGGHQELKLPIHAWFNLKDFQGTDAAVQHYNSDKSNICDVQPRLSRQHLCYTPPDWQNDRSTVPYILQFLPTVFNPPLVYPQSDTGLVTNTAHSSSFVKNVNNWEWHFWPGDIQCGTTGDNGNPWCRPDHSQITRVNGGLMAPPHGVWNQKWPGEAYDPQRRGLSRSAQSPRASAPAHTFPTQWAHSDSDQAAFQATTICKNRFADGPDYANSHERMYCNMATRELLPFCDEEVQTECFDFEAGGEKRDGGNAEGFFVQTKREREDVGSVRIGSTE